MDYIENSKSERIAYIHTPASSKGEHLPAVMFLGGFRSDMSGTKALYFEAQCKSRGQEFLRFDYSGHGVSDGIFADGTIGIWKNDAREVLDKLIEREVILVGSSMGGWISLLLLLERPARIKGIVGIAAAPDFTNEMKARLTPQQLSYIKEHGRIDIPNEYSDEPYIITQALLDDGTAQCLLDRNYDHVVSMSLIQGKCDADVPWEKALRIQSCFPNAACEVTFIDDGDHRLSRQDDLEIINAQIIKLSAL